MKYAGIIVLASLVLAGCQTLSNQYKQAAMETRVYPCSPGILRSDLRKLFSEAGVPFPEGSSISFNDGTGALIVKNTPQALDVVDQLLGASGVVEEQVRTELVIIEVADPALAEKLRTHGATIHELLEPAGSRAKPVRRMSVVSLSGAAAAVQDVFLSGVSQSQSTNVTNAVITNTMVDAADENYLAVTSVIGPNGDRVFVTIKAQSVLPQVNRALKTSELVEVVKIDTSLVLRDGEAEALDLPEQPGGGFHDLWAVITVRLIASDGRPIRSEQELARKRNSFLGRRN